MPTAATLIKLTTNWKPRHNDLAWTENLVRQVRVGGAWIVPMNQSIWRIERHSVVHSGFTLQYGHAILTCGDPEDDTNQRIAKTLEALSYLTFHEPEKTQ